jgi:NAD-dependent deacetylase
MNIPAELILDLHRAKSIVVLTGAGISAESGIPTFRDAMTGLWAKFRPEELATPRAFNENPQLVWDWYNWRRGLVEQADPNPGHYALAELEKHMPGFTLITQNVDGLHQRAGSKNVIELHGNITQARCSVENTLQPLKNEASGAIPKCPNCGSHLRPDVVWFGEPLPKNALDAAVNASEAADIYLSIGTSGIVEPAATLPYIALRNNVPVIEVNPGSTPLTVYARYYFPHSAGDFLPDLIRTVWPNE